MSLLLNLLWIVLGGFVIALEYALAGLVLCLTIVGIPAGVQCWKIAAFALLPFGTTFVPAEGAGALSFGLNVLWFLLAGVWIFLSHVALGAALCVTLIGIPFGVQHFKLALLALAPFGKELRDT
jgi:uncharacterized membrane protein YccF (DUF307 family)